MSSCGNDVCVFGLGRRYLLQQPFAAKPNGDSAKIPKQPPVVHTQCLPRRAAQYGQHTPRLSPAAETVFSRARQARQASRPCPGGTPVGPSGVSHFYSHQILGCNAVRRGDHCVVATSTGSGKSLVFSVPIVETLLEEPQATALLLFVIEMQSLFTARCATPRKCSRHTDST